MLLPSMAPALNLTYSQMGLISTFNFFGYLLAVLFCGHITEKIGTRKLIFIALLLVGFSMILVSSAQNFYSALLFYMMTGIGSGAANVPMMALVSAWFASKKRGKAAGYVVIGSGFAILLSGKLIPFLNGLAAYGGWRLSWQILGAMVLGISVICLAVLRDSPKELGLKPIGSVQKETISSVQIDYCASGITKGEIFHLGAIYFLFGATYVIYATFIVTALVQERGFSEATAGSFWSWVGFLSLFSGPVFGTLSDKLGRKVGLIIVFSIQTIAYILIAVNLPGLFLFLSIGFFGIVAWSIPSIMAALVGDYVGPQKAARIFGLITFIFALGQILGPYVAGYLAELTNSFSSSFYMAAVLAGSAVVLSASLRKPSNQKILSR